MAINVNNATDTLSPSSGVLQLAGIPLANTANPGTNNTQVATTQFVTAAVAGAVGSSPSNTNPAVDSGATGGPGISALYSRGDHFHPSDPTKLTLATGGTINGALAVNAPLTANSGLSLGAVTVTGIDLSKHIALYGTSFGLNVLATANVQMIANNAVSVSFNASGMQGPVGMVTPNQGAFTTLTANSTVSGAGFSALLAPYLTSVVQGNSGIAINNNNTISNTGVLTINAAVGAFTLGAGLQLNTQQIVVKPATAAALGGIIAGGGLSVDVGGVLSVSASGSYLPISGGTLTAPGLLSVSGSAATPGITFGTANTGLFGNATTQVNISIGGSLVHTFSNTVYSTSTTISTAPGTAGTPAYNFQVESNSGLYRSSAGVIQMSVTGSPVMGWNGTGQSVALFGQLLGTAGTLASPGYTFSGDTTTGIYRPASGSIRISGVGSDVAGFVGATKTSTFYGPVVLNGDPGGTLEAATKQYVDGKTPTLVQSTGIQITNGNTIAVKPATAVALGGIIAGNGVTVDVSGNLTSSTGTVQSITTNNGITGGPITASGTVGLTPIAASSLFGNPAVSTAPPSAITVGTGLALATNGTLTATGTAPAQGTGITITGGNTINNAGVLSLDTATGALTLGAGLSRNLQQIYVKPASSLALGGIIGGSGTTIDANGTLSVTATGVGTVTTITAGGVLSGGSISTAGTIGLQVGTGLTSAVNGTISIAPATSLVLGGVIAGNGIGINAGGTITASGTGTVTSVAQTFTGGLITVGGSPIVGAGVLALTVAGTSGGVPYFTSASAWASSTALTTNAMMLGGAAGPKTTAGFLTDGASSLTIGGSSSATGTLALAGGVSGAVTLRPQASAPGSYNFNLPIAAGNVGQVLTSQGGGATAMTWSDVPTNAVTTITAGGVLSGGAITNIGTVGLLAGTGLTSPANGTLALAPATSSILGGVIVSTGLAVNAGGTITATGTGTVSSVSFTGGIVSVATPTSTPALTVAGTQGGIPYFSGASAWATTAQMAQNGFMFGGGNFAPTTSPYFNTNGSAAATFGAANSVAGSLLLQSAVATPGSLALAGITSGSVLVRNTNTAATPYNFNLPATAGTAGQALTSQAGGAAAMTWADVPQGTVRSVTAGGVLAGGVITDTGTISLNVTSGITNNSGTLSNSGVLSVDTAVGALTLGAGLTRNLQQIYVKPATSLALGGVIAGGGITIDGSGVISTAGGPGSGMAGPIYVGVGLTADTGTSITSTGTLSLAKATSSTLGGVIAGSGIAIDPSGVISASGGPGSSLVIQDTAPTPTNGGTWWSSAEGQLYVGYNDGTSTQWVIANSLVQPAIAYANLPQALQSVPVSFFLAGKPASSAKYNVAMPWALTVPAGLAGSVIYTSTPTGGTPSFILNKITGGTTISAVGTISVSANSNTGCILTGSGGSIGIGDVLQIQAPVTQDGTLADLSITILGQRV